MSGSKTATLTPNPNSGLALMAAVAVTQTNKIYILGGWQGPGSGPAVARVFSDSPDKTGDITEWVQEDIRDLPEPLLRHSAVFAPNGSIYVVGGQTTTSGGHRKAVNYLPTIDLEKSSYVKNSPLSEGGEIAYTIDYANSSLISQTITITDVIPFNTNLIPDSVSPPPPDLYDSTLIWHLGEVFPGRSGQVSFSVRVALLPFLAEKEAFDAASLFKSSPTNVLPVSIACDTTRFWASGVTRQPPVPNPHTIQVEIPPGSNPSQAHIGSKVNQIDQC